MEELFTGSCSANAQHPKKWRGTFLATDLDISPTPKGYESFLEDWRPGALKNCAVTLPSAASVTIFHSNLLTLESLASSHCTTEALSSLWLGSSQLIATKYLKYQSERHHSICFEPSPTNAKSNRGFVITGYYNFTTFIDEAKCISEVFKHMFRDIQRHLKLFAKDVLFYL